MLGKNALRRVDRWIVEGTVSRHNPRKLDQGEQEDRLETKDRVLERVSFRIFGTSRSR
jgi:hypothetical protein